jgi:putative acetyltransferase
LNIRYTEDADRLAIDGIHMDAFGQAQCPEIVELVNGLFDDETAKPLYSLVAEIDRKIVGHILFTRVRLQPECQNLSGQILAPLAVAKNFQGKGVGGSLIKEGLKQLAASGVALAFVLGHPGYYPKFGFQPAGAVGFEAPFPIPVQHANAWMAQELRPGVIGRARGRIQCADVLNHPRHWRE